MLHAFSYKWNIDLVIKMWTYNRASSDPGAWGTKVVVVWAASLGGPVVVSLGGFGLSPGSSTVCCNLQQFPLCTFVSSCKMRDGR